MSNMDTGTEVGRKEAPTWRLTRRDHQQRDEARSRCGWSGTGEKRNRPKRLGRGRKRNLATGKGMDREIKKKSGLRRKGFGLKEKPGKRKISKFRK